MWDCTRRMTTVANAALLSEADVMTESAVSGDPVSASRAP